MISPQRRRDAKKERERIRQLVYISLIKNFGLENGREIRSNFVKHFCTQTTNPATSASLR
jgi:hypothetical protein